MLTIQFVVSWLDRNVAPYNGALKFEVQTVLELCVEYLRAVKCGWIFFNKSIVKINWGTDLNLNILRSISHSRSQTAKKNNIGPVRVFQEMLTLQRKLQQLLK